MSKIKSIPLRVTIPESDQLLHAELLKLEPRQRARWLINAATAFVTSRMVSTSEVEALVTRLLNEHGAVRSALTPAPATDNGPVSAASLSENPRPPINAGVMNLKKSAMAIWPVDRTTTSSTT